MELLCIQTHSQRAVIAGNTYPFIQAKTVCGCGEMYNVGIKCSGSGTEYPSGRKIKLNIGDYATCRVCRKEKKMDGVWWLSPKLFIPIGNVDENKKYNEEELISR